MIAALFAGFPRASVCGMLPGTALVIYGTLTPGRPWVQLIIVRALLALGGWVIAVGLRQMTKLTVDLSSNLFGSRLRPQHASQAVQRIRSGRPPSGGLSAGPAPADPWTITGALPASISSPTTG
jgi:hypothetical protein